MTSVEPLDSQRMAPYGVVLSQTGIDTRREMPISGIPEEVVMRARNRSRTVTFMERHHRVAQLFVALADNEFAVVVVPAHVDQPSPSDLRAFRLSEGSVVMLHASVWHAVSPLILSGNGDYFLLTEVQTSAGEATDVVDVRRTEIAMG